MNGSKCGRSALAPKHRSVEPRVVLVIGDALLTDPRVRELLADRVSTASQDLDVTVLRPGQDSLERAGTSLAQVGMFSTGRALWIRGFTGDSTDAEELLGVLTRGIPSESTLVVSAPAIDQRSRLYKWFVANAAVEDLSIGVDKRGRLLDDELEAFIRRRIEDASGGEAAPEVVRLIRDRAGSDVGNLAQEIDKLCLAAAPGQITARDVRTHVRDQTEAWVFDLTNAISERRLARAAVLVERLLDQGEPPIRIVAVLATHVADLLEAARLVPSIPRTALRNAGAFARDYFPKLPAEFRNRFKSGFRAYYVLQGAAAFQFDELRKLHTALASADLALKSSRVAPEHLLAAIVEQACATRAQ